MFSTRGKPSRRTIELSRCIIRREYRIRGKHKTVLQGAFFDEYGRARPGPRCPWDSGKPTYSHACICGTQIVGENPGWPLTPTARTIGGNTALYVNTRGFDDFTDFRYRGGGVLKSSSTLSSTAWSFGRNGAEPRHHTSPLPALLTVSMPWRFRQNLVAAFYRELFSLLRGAGIEVQINPKAAGKFPIPIPLDQDGHSCILRPRVCKPLIGAILLSTDIVLQEFSRAIHRQVRARSTFFLGQLSICVGTRF